MFTPLLCLAFFLYGVSGLLFEILWFRLSGLAFGNSLWTGAVMPASFMGGLAFGQALAAHESHF
ncbi:MAG: hypothetical protein AB1641_04205 [Thermodesulfobacteriota bacterium]